MSDALQWLNARERPAPEALRARMAEAVGLQGDAAPVWRALAEAGIALLADVLPRAESRAAALDLLAADALLTYAAEAAAEQGRDALDTYVREYGPRRMAMLLDATGAA